MRSSHVADEFKIFVGHCGTAEAAEPAVLYVTDANGLLDLRSASGSMQLARHLPPLLVVRIGYRVGGLTETITVRTRDLTPSFDADFASLFPDQASMGGAAGLHAFIQTELMPWVASRFRVDPTDSSYFGHSLGGLFGAYVLMRAPATFQRYVIGSPALWWDHGVLFDLESQYAQEHDDLPARVFFGIGADETHDGRVREAANLPPEERTKATAWYIDMVADMTRMVERLRGRGYPSLDLHSEVFPGEFHVTVPLLNLSRGLRCLFDAPR